MLTQNKRSTTQLGFTLVEIAIVLVIIGLLLGGVLKGQAMIESAKVKNLANDLKGVTTMFYAYQDKFHAIPGDDKKANAHCGAVSATTLGGDGVIAGTWNILAGADLAATPGSDESSLFWNHVRLAGLATGDAVDTALPLNAVGGILGINSTAAITGQPGNYVVCSGNIDGKLVRQLDIMLDDGKGDAGSMRTRAAKSTAGAGAAVEPPVDGTLYDVCLSL